MRSRSSVQNDLLLMCAAYAGKWWLEWPTIVAAHLPQANLPLCQKLTQLELLSTSPRPFKLAVSFTQSTCWIVTVPKTFAIFWHQNWGSTSLIDWLGVESKLVICQVLFSFITDHFCHFSYMCTIRCDSTNAFEERLSGSVLHYPRQPSPWQLSKTFHFSLWAQPFSTARNTFDVLDALHKLVCLEEIQTLLKARCKRICQPLLGQWATCEFLQKCALWAKLHFINKKIPGKFFL